MLIKLATQENKISLFQHFPWFSNYNSGLCQIPREYNFARETDTAHHIFKNRHCGYKSRCLLNKRLAAFISNSYQPCAPVSLISVYSVARREVLRSFWLVIVSPDLQEDENLKIEAKRGWSLSQILMFKQQSVHP